MLEHFVNFLKEKKISINYICYIYPANPLLKITTIKNSFKN